MVVPAGSSYTSVSSFSATLVNLPRGVPYFVRVSARNAFGWGASASSSPLWLSARETPGAPASVSVLALSPWLLKVSWSPPASDGGAEVDHYEVQWDTSADFASAGSPGYDYTAQVPAQSCCFFNLPATVDGAHYYVKVRAHNDRGYSPTALASPWGEQGRVRPPGPPQAVTLAALSGRAVKVLWQPPRNDLQEYGGDG